MHMRRFASFALLVAALALSLGGARAQQPTTTVFAAASLTEALKAAAALRPGAAGTVTFSFASSSVLAKQIESGAPAGIFISADERWMDYLAARDLIVPASRVQPIGNRLVLIAPLHSEVETSGTLPDIAALLQPGERLAVGDPSNVPAGTYAREALTRLRQWEVLEPKLARGENVRAALAFVERGEAPLGIVYATDAAASKRVKVIAHFPADLHSPIVYPFALLRDADPAAADWLKHLTSPAALAEYARLGFTAAGM